MKKLLQIGSVLGVIALALVLVIPFGASAESDKPAKGLEKATQAIQKMDAKLSGDLEKAWKIGDNEHSVMIRANGEFRVHGAKVNSVSDSVLNVSLFGFSRDVNVAGAKLIGGGNALSLADFKAGDVLVATGKFDAQAKTITVSEIHNLSFRKDTSTIEARIAELLKMVRQLQNQLKNR